MTKCVMIMIFFGATTMLLGCSTLESMRTWILDRQRPVGDEESQKCKEKFEEGRRIECRGDIQIAIEKYKSIINGCRGNRYGRYGLAKLLLKFYHHFLQQIIFHILKYPLILLHKKDLLHTILLGNSKNHFYYQINT